MRPSAGTNWIVLELELNKLVGSPRMRDMIVARDHQPQGRDRDAWSWAPFPS